MPTSTSPPAPLSISAADRLLVARVIGDTHLIREAEAEFYTSAEGITLLRKQGRHLEAMLAAAHADR